MTIFYRRLIPVLLVIFVLTGNVFSADVGGKFSIRGAGLLTCKTLVAERAEQSKAYLMIGGWLDGYLTGINQYAVDTYDSSSFESTELFLAVMAQHCKDHSQDRLFSVVNTIVKKLHAERLQKASPLITVHLGEHATQLYQEVIKRIQQALKARGHFKGGATGEWNKKTTQALQAFQSGVKLESSGFPDQTTLWRLLRKDEKNP